MVQRSKVRKLGSLWRINYSSNLRPLTEMSKTEASRQTTQESVGKSVDTLLHHLDDYATINHHLW